jgi:hypothetical protein
MQFDFTILIIWYIVPFLILGGRAALQGYRTKKKRDQLRKLEESVTPFSKE